MTGFDGSGFFADPTTDARLRRNAPPTRGEKDVLSDFLDFFRHTFELKCDGLTPEQLATRSVPPSTLSLLGLLRHLARVEHAWFRRVLEGQPELAKLYSDDGDVPFDEAVGTDECVAEAWESWRREVEHGRAWYAACSDLGSIVDVGGEPTEVREVVVHLIEEYARHCGHADLLRKCVDGRTGV